MINNHNKWMVIEYDVLIQQNIYNKYIYIYVNNFILNHCWISKTNPNNEYLPKINSNFTKNIE